MKKYITSLLILISITAFGQKTELKLSFNSGLFSFTGAAAENNTFINFDDKGYYGYTNNPYGSKNGLCYGLSGNIKRVTKRNLILGFDLGYEVLRSKILIDRMSFYTDNSTYQSEATGESFLKYSSINLYPQIGYRFNTIPVSFDVTGGFDLGYCLKATEKGNATLWNGAIYITSVDRETIKTDIRPRLQVSTNYKKAGFYVGYSYGLANYLSGSKGGSPEAYARLIRFGLTYKLK